MGSPTTGSCEPEVEAVGWLGDNERFPVAEPIEGVIFTTPQGEHGGSRFKYGTICGLDPSPNPSKNEFLS